MKNQADIVDRDLKMIIWIHVTHVADLVMVAVIVHTHVIWAVDDVIIIVMITSAEHFL